jgi:L-lactate dehydrogenase complex protein LldG
MIEIIRRALGRTTPLQNPPIPPEISDTVARLSSRDGDIPQRFAKSAADAKFLLEQLSADELPSRLVDFLRLNRFQKIGVSSSPLFDRLAIPEKIEQAGLALHRWPDSTLDAAYDLDCGITDVYAAVAETGSLVISPDAAQGRALSLVPPIHVAIVEPQKIVPDLIDLLTKVAADGLRSNVTLITGPSKTADIEGALVTGVHGPGLVQVYLLK